MKKLLFFVFLLLISPSSNARYSFFACTKGTLATINSESSNGVDKGFAKTLNLVKYDKDKACFGYASSLNTMKYEKYEYLKKISRQLQ